MIGRGSLDGPFGQYVSLFVAIKPNVGGDLAEGDKLSTGVVVTKETLCFQN